MAYFADKSKKKKEETDEGMIQGEKEEMEAIDSKTEEKEEHYSVAYPTATKFSQLPISSKTLNALTKEKFIEMTDIQRASSSHALCGRDILGAAKTGSGKTLAFLIPLVEKLYRLRWTGMDGIGAIIISPTRELASQTFDTLRAIGHAHNLSAGLVIGGNDLKEEQPRINRINILVCTPGRLLQHMDETKGFDCTNLQILGLQIFKSVCLIFKLCI